MRLRRAGVVAVVGGLALLTSAGGAGAAVSITAPASAHLGSAPTGSTSLTGQLDDVRATASALLSASFVATVSITVNFKTGAGTADETIPKESISYWSGTATSSSGSCTAGQPTAAQAVTLGVAREAFRCSGLSVLGLANVSATWKPRVIVNIPPAAVAGTYSGTITHSVA